MTVLVNPIESGWGEATWQGLRNAVSKGVLPYASIARREIRDRSVYQYARVLTLSLAFHPTQAQIVQNGSSARRGGKYGTEAYINTRGFLLFLRLFTLPRRKSFRTVRVQGAAGNTGPKRISIREGSYSFSLAFHPTQAQIVQNGSSARRGGKYGTEAYINTRGSGFPDATQQSGRSERFAIRRRARPGPAWSWRSCAAGCRARPP